MDNNRGWLRELLIVLGLIAGIVIAVIALTWVFGCRDKGSWCDYVLSTWIKVIIQFAISGAFGGFLLLFAQSKLEDVLQSKDDGWSKFSSFAVAHCCAGGVGGSFALLFFLVYNQNIKEPIDLTDVGILKNCMSGVVAGFIGFALLRHMADWLEKFTDIKQAAVNEASRATIGEARSTATTAASAEMNRLKQDLSTLDSAIRRALEVREKNLPPDSEAFKNAFENLRFARRNFPEHRTAAMVMANMNYDRKDFQEAIKIVTGCIAVIERQKTPETEAVSNKDIADLYYNRGHYYARLYHEGPPQQKESARTHMVSDLRRSFELSPQNVDEIDYPVDTDLGNIKDDPKLNELKALYRQYKNPPPTD